MRLRDISLNNLKRRKGRTLFLILGLTLGVTTVVTLISVGRIMNEDISRKLDAFGANIVIMPRSDNFSISYGGINIGGVSIHAQSLKDSDVSKIRLIQARENINVVAPKLIGVVEIQGKRLPIMGVQFHEEMRLKKWWKIHGAWPKGPDEVLLGSEVAARLLKSTGDSLKISGNMVRVSGVLEETGSQEDYFILADLGFVQQTTKKPKALSLIEVSALCNTCPIEEIVKQISAKLPHAKVTAIKHTLETKMEAVHHFGKFSFGISIIVLLIGGLIVFTNMMASVHERKREIGILRAIGFRKSHVTRIIFLEALIVGLIAGILGYGLGLGVSHFISPILTSMRVEKIHVDPFLALGAVLLSSFVAILSSAYPAVQASKMDPTIALSAL